MRFRVPVGRIPRDVVRANNALTVEGRGEHLRVAGHRELRERLARNARDGVEHVALTGLVLHVVEERAELGSGELHARVRHTLDKPLEIVLRRRGGQGPC